VSPEFPELDQQGIRQEYVASAAILGDLGPQPDAVLRLPFRRIDITHVEPYNLGQPKPSPEGQ